MVLKTVFSISIAYFTQIIHYAFLRRIQKEKKQLEIRQKIIERSGFDEVFVADDSDLGKASTHEEMLDEAQRREHPEIAEHEWIDETFRVWETRFGLWQSETKEGRKMLTGLTKDVVVNMTRWHLKCEQDGTLEQYTRVVNSGVVGGKL
jgi:hypothetical protein